MKSKLATVVTGAMLMLTTNILPSYALNTHKHSVTNNNPTDQLANNQKLITQRRRIRHRRGRWITQNETVCDIKWVYNQQQRTWARVRLCRSVPRRVFVRS